MTAPTPTSLAHDAAWELLPWLANGSLDAFDRARVEAHLEQCSACRVELEEQRLICNALAAPGAIEQIPAASLNKLRQRIERLPTETREAGELAAAATPRRRPPAQRLRTLSVAAAALVAVVVLGLPAAHDWQGATGSRDAARYFTVSSSAAQPPRAVIRAVFAETLTLADLQRLLADAHLRIVEGPSEAGVYSLAMGSGESTARALQRLRAHDGVRFAEAITPAPDPLP
jgi:anti-sigma factor RsiW